MARILIAGDFSPKDRLKSEIEKKQYQIIFSEIKPILSSVDYSIVNFESTIANPPDQRPILKCGPALSCSRHSIEALKYAGFSCCTLANNHIYDYGDEGVKNTIKAIREFDLDFVGGGANIEEASKTLYIKIGEECIAIINCCEHEFSIASASSAGANPLNPIRQYYAIQRARELADCVIVIVHGGKEHIQVPSSRMVDTYRFLIDVGADVVINHHQHCINGMELYHDKPIFYGLGNFCFDWNGKRDCMWNDGYMAVINTKDLSSYELIPYKQCNETVSVSLLSDTDKSSFDAYFSELCSVLHDPDELNRVNTSFALSHAKVFKSIFEPYQTKIARLLYFKGILPSFVSRKNSIVRLNFVECESQRDMLIDVLKKLH